MKIINTLKENKKYFIVSLFVLLFISILNFAYASSGSYGGNTRFDGYRYTVSSDIIKATVDTTGRFGITTVKGFPEITSDDNKILLYNEDVSRTSALVVKIDGNLYDLYGYTPTSIITSDGKITVNYGTINGVDIQVIYTIYDDKYILINFVATNKTNVQKNIGFKIYYDTCVAGNDGSPIKVVYKGFEIYNDSYRVKAVGVLKNNDVVTPPTDWRMEDWDSSNRTYFPYDDGIPHYSNSYYLGQTYQTRDTAISLWWHSQKVSPNQKRSITTLLGIDIPENNKPVARFTINPNPVVADEPYSIDDTSYDPDGDPIVKREWRIQKPDGTWATISEWKPTFEEMGLGDDGTYKIQLRVLDNPTGGNPNLTPMWSDPYTVIVQVQRKLIVIGSSNKSTYKAGEAMILYAHTEGKAYRVEAKMWYSKNEFTTSNVTTLTSDIALTNPPQDVMTWHTKHTKAEGRDIVVIIPKNMPDGTYNITITAYARYPNGTEDTKSITIPITVKGSIYDYYHSEINN